MIDIAARLDTLCKAAGHPVVSVSLGRVTDKTTWRVSPDSLQAACQPIIDAFDATDPAHETAQRAALALMLSRQKDILATIMWAIILRDQAAWNALTPAQKKARVLAEADNWRDVRVVVEEIVT